jgi:hypothetical protein
MGNRSQVFDWKKELLLLVLLLCSLDFTGSTLLLTLNSQSLHQDSILIIQFCKLCPSPEREGSIGLPLLLLSTDCLLSSRFDVKVWRQGISSHWRSALHLFVRLSLTLDLELIFCVPNHGQVKRMTNRRQLKDKIGFVFRGEVSLHEKALHAQAVRQLSVSLPLSLLTVFFS